MNKPVTEWSAITSSIDIPKLQKTFCGVLGYIFTLVFDPETVDQLVPTLMETFGVLPDDQVIVLENWMLEHKHKYKHDNKLITNIIFHNQVFVMDSFLPSIRNASSHHYLGLNDRLNHHHHHH